MFGRPIHTARHRAVDFRFGENAFSSKTFRKLINSCCPVQSVLWWSDDVRRWLQQLRRTRWCCSSIVRVESVCRVAAVPRTSHLCRRSVLNSL